jgi:hypothetical protein
MALHTKKLYYQREGVTYPIDLYTTSAEAGTDYIMLRDGTTTVYAAAGDVADAAASHLRIRKSDVTKAILTEFVASGWLTVGSGMNGDVFAFTEYNSMLHAVGTFTTAGGLAANRVAKWNGSAWSALGSGVPNVGEYVFAAAPFGSYLVIGGAFSSPSSNLAKWDGSAWSSISNGANGSIYAMAEFAGSLYFGGAFSMSGGWAVGNIARTSGTSIFQVGDGTGLDGPVNSMCVFNNELYVSGGFTLAGATAVNYIAKWNGSSWSAVGTGLSDPASVMCVFNNELYVGGNFSSAGGVTAFNIAKWNGTSWAALHVNGLNNAAYAMAVFNNELYIGGNFIYAGGLPINRIAKWNGTAFSAVGDGVSGTVRALRPIGTDIYAGGLFPGHVSKWVAPV